MSNKEVYVGTYREKILREASGKTEVNTVHNNKEKLEQDFLKACKKARESIDKPKSAINNLSQNQRLIQTSKFHK
ncbi:hypothetical protein [Tenacibaculum caenipelagi]|uniref:Uncharacterized protein n=1 Tax=Tenacibaculum caenipelagi TaxID=1325435 RepID=A0A4R6TFT6_9FLAO|nr:hypothetical protein [Tenacibaculum caenipelagi]TDQ27640.1 hypothetical protein DFQ07_1491 [Tenacibaculum caenipelagi]